MAFLNGRAGILMYTINALVERDPGFTIHDAARAGEDGFTNVLLERAKAAKIDVSLLDLCFSEDPQSRNDVDDLYARWTHASDTGSFMLSDEVNGWLWVSSISVNAFFAEPYGELPAQTA